jgi:hypothetical protein
MLTKDDELICHQTTSTFDHVDTSDLRWTERTAILAFDLTGNVSFLTGLARYPNRNVIDAYGMVTVENKTAHIVRVSRELRPEPVDPRVGPLSYEVVEPLKRVRSVLGENEYGLSFDIEFEGTFPPYEQPPMFSRSRGRVREDVRRYYQSGRPSGWIKADGKTYEVSKEAWRAVRDHSWGTRWGSGGGTLPEGSYLQPPEIPPGVLYFMGIFDFGKWILHFAVREDWEGKPWHFEGWVAYPYGSEKEGEGLQLLSVEHDLKFRSDIRVIESGRAVLNAVDGSKREISIRPITTYYPGPASYDYYNDYMSGMWKGPQYIDGFKVDISDPEVLKQISLLTETWCEVRCGDDVGYGNLEMLFVGKYPRYGYHSY